MENEAKISENQGEENVGWQYSHWFLYLIYLGKYIDIYDCKGFLFGLGLEYDKLKICFENM